MGQVQRDDDVFYVEYAFWDILRPTDPMKVYTKAKALNL